ncbi:MAG: ankyrin repeat domain-containing protein [Gemmatimonas sp.]|jgi:ankyrin repeat protein|uniref:ankyrin repeat domain-containing protein n=1 Tax=Gemmatimonas sp. TaxID=1962908 RepID=UPI00391F33D6|nr:ankyrin repeat domain-containing protein [Gemmatimonadota bacterium]
MIGSWRGTAAVALAGVMVTVATASLPEAASRGDLTTVRALIAARADVNAALGDGMTALHWAAERGDAAMAHLLLKAGAKVTPVTRNGAYTPLHVAARAGSGAVVQALLAAGADPTIMTATGATALHLAAQAGDVVAVKALLAKKADPNARETEWGQTPLMFAASADRPAVIAALLKAGANPSLKTNTQNLTEELARQQAAARKRNEVLFSYLPATVRDSVMKAQAKTEAEQAAQRRLFGGGGDGPAAPPPRPDSTKPSAAPATAPRADSARGPRVGLAAPPVQSLTPKQIEEAILAGRAMYASKDVGKTTETVIPRDTTNGFQANYEATVGNVGGLTALHHAVRQGHVAATMALLDGGANINEVSVSDSTSPVLHATINGHFDLAMALVQRGANVKLASIHGLTPLYAAINTYWYPRSRYPQPQSVQLQKTTHYELMQALITAGADVNARLTKNIWFFGYSNCGNANCGLELLDGTTPFWRATYAVDLEAMKMLKAAGAIDTMPSYRPPQLGRRRAPTGFAEGMTPPGVDKWLDSAAKAVPAGIGTYPIHSAAGVGYGNGFAGNAHRHAPDGWLPVMKYLVEELGHDVNKRDLNGYTPLHHAAARGDNEMILYLVSKGADPKAVGRDYRTTVDLANGPVQRLRPFPETIQLLEKLGARNNHRCVSC